MSKLIVVIGVTGAQGSSVAHTYSQLPGWKVRGITRNPSGAAAQALIAKGIEVVKGDLDDKQSLFPAFEGANVIFANTDFFAPLFAAVQSKELAKGRPANEYAFDKEAEWGINIAEAAASPAVIKTLERFVYSSLSNASKWSKGKYTRVLHNDVKSHVERTIQSRFPEVAARMSSVQIGQYVSNWEKLGPLAPQKQLDGSYLFERTHFPEYVAPFVVPDEDTGAFVKLLVDAPAGTTLLGVSENLTWPQYTQAWAEVHGVKAAYKQVSKDYIMRGLPDVVKQEMGDAWDYTDEFGHEGGDPSVVSPWQLDPKVKLTSVREYIQKTDWSSVM